jgi:hypothetical protein
MDTSIDQPSADTQQNPAPGTPDPSLHDPAPLAPGNTGDPAAPPIAEPIADPLAADPEPPAAGTDPAPGVKKWYDDLSDEDLKSNPTLQKYKTQEEAHKAHLELASLLGNDKIALPKDENDTVAIEALNRALGVPVEAIGENGYKFAELEGIEGIEGMEFGDDSFAAIMHKHNIPQAAAAGLRQEYAEMIDGMAKQNKEAYVEHVNKAKTELTKEWGLKYDANVKLAQSVMNKHVGSKEEFDHVNALIGADPVALKMLAKLGGQFSEGSLGDIGDQGSGFTKTPADAKAEYDKIMNDNEDIYWAGVRNQKVVPEGVRKERVAHVENLLMMMQPAIPQE